MNHLALTTSRSRVDSGAASCEALGWTLMFTDRHPRAGGPAHYAALLVDDDGYELELVAAD